VQSDPDGGYDGKTGDRTVGRGLYR
jgi:hypothetical protein